MSKARLSEDRIRAIVQGREARRILRIGDPNDDEGLLATEVEAHRAMERRLEAWADELDATGSPYDRPIAAEIRSRMRGPS